MDIGRERPTDAQPIGSRLLLADAPLLRATGLHHRQSVDQVRPDRSRLHLDHSARCVEIENPIKAAHIEEKRALSELLASHRVTSARDANALIAAIRLSDGRLQVDERCGSNDAFNIGRI
jgi:hypothetical protein